MDLNGAVTENVESTPPVHLRPFVIIMDLPLGVTHEVICENARVQWSKGS